MAAARPNWLQGKLYGALNTTPEDFASNLQHKDGWQMCSGVVRRQSQFLDVCDVTAGSCQQLSNAELGIGGACRCKAGSEPIQAGSVSGGCRGMQVWSCYIAHFAVTHATYQVVSAEQSAADALITV
jgi:hypothetical protein